jgi:hypothetical protein
VVALMFAATLAARYASAQATTIEVTPPGTAPAGATITVKWSGPNGPGDFITVVRQGARPSDYLDYKETGSGRAPVNPVQLVLPAETGAYEIRYVRGNPRSVLATVPYAVTTVTATVDGPASVAPGARFEIAWQGPNGRGDWVTIVASGAAARTYGSYVDARNGRADDKTNRRTATLQAPKEPGRYELRYVQQGTRVIGTRPIEVSAATAGALVTAAPQPATPGRVTSTTPVVAGSPTAAGTPTVVGTPAATQTLAPGPSRGANSRELAMTCARRLSSIAQTFAERRAQVLRDADESLAAADNDAFAIKAIQAGKFRQLAELQAEEARALEEANAACGGTRPPSTASAAPPAGAAPPTAPPATAPPPRDCQQMINEILASFAARRAEILAWDDELQADDDDPFARKVTLAGQHDALRKLQAEQDQAVAAATQACAVLP